MVIISDCSAFSMLRCFFPQQVDFPVELSQAFLASGNKNYLGFYVYKGWGYSLKRLQELVYRFSGKITGPLSEGLVGLGSMLQRLA